MKEPVGTLHGIPILEPGVEVADHELGILTVEKIQSLRVHEIVNIGAAYKRLYEEHRKTAIRYRDAVYLCADALGSKGVDENTTTPEGSQVKFRRYARFSSKEER